MQSGITTTPVDPPIEDRRAPLLFKTQQSDNKYRTYQIISPRGIAAVFCNGWKKLKLGLRVA